MNFYEDPSVIPSFLERELESLVSRYNSEAIQKEGYPVLKKIAFANYQKIGVDFSKMAGKNIYYYEDELHLQTSNYNKLILALESPNHDRQLKFVYLYIQPSTSGKKLNFGLRFSSVQKEEDESHVAEVYKKYYYKKHQIEDEAEETKKKAKRDEIREEHIFNHYYSGEFQYDTCISFAIFLNKVLRDYLHISNYKQINQISPLGILIKTQNGECISVPQVKKVFFSSSKVDDIDNASFIKVKSALESDAILPLPVFDDDEELEFNKDLEHKVELNPFLTYDNDLIDTNFNDELDVYNESNNDFCTSSFNLSLPEDAELTPSKSSSDSSDSSKSSFDSSKSSSDSSESSFDSSKSSSDSSDSSKSSTNESNILGLTVDSSDEFSPIKDNKNDSPETKIEKKREKVIKEILLLFKKELDTKSKRNEYLRMISLILMNTQKSVSFILYELKKLLQSNLFRSKKSTSLRVWFEKRGTEFPLYQLTHPGNDLVSSPSSIKRSSRLDFEQKIKFITKFNQLIQDIRKWDKSTKLKFGLKKKMEFEVYNDLTIYFEPKEFLKTLLIFYLTNYNFVVEDGVEVRIVNGEFNVNLYFTFLLNENTKELFVSLKNQDNTFVLDQTQKDDALNFAISEFCDTKNLSQSELKIKFNENWLEDKPRIDFSRVRMLI